MQDFGEHQILSTKIFPPKIPSDFVARKYLLDKLDRYTDFPLVLVSAPAGYGKSTTVSHWLSQQDVPYAWISLGEEDNELTSFLEYLVASIRKQYPNFGHELEQIIRAPADTPALEVAKVFLNEIEKLNDKFILVLDDYHLIHNKGICDILELFVKHPSRLSHLVLITRSDPSLPIHLYRVNNKVLEIRTDDLAFTTDFTSEYIQKSLNATISESTSFKLNNSVEGWISGLKMIVISTSAKNFDEKVLHLQGLPTSYLPDLIQNFLKNQTNEMKRFILSSSILKQFNSSLCDHLLGNENQISGKAFIEYLEKSNLFIIELDDKSNWYRYHYLFGELLGQELKSFASPEEINGLNYNAATWYEKNDYINFAIEHYLKSDNVKAAISLFTRYRIELLSEQKWGQLSLLLDFFTEKQINNIGVLALTKSWLQIYKGHVFEMFDSIGSVEGIIINEDNDESLRKGLLGEFYTLFMYKQYHFDQKYDLVLEYGEKALLLLPEKHVYPIGYAWIFIGGALQVLDRTEEAITRLYKTIDNENDVVINNLVLLIINYIFWIEGNSAQLKKSAKKLLDFGNKSNNLEGIAHGHLFMGMSHYLVAELDQAASHLEEALLLKNHTIGVQVFFASSALASTYLFLKNYKKSDQVIINIEALVNNRGGQAFRSIWTAVHAELQMQKGEPQNAENWLGEDPEFQIIPVANHVDANMSLIKVLLFEGSKESLKKALVLIEKLVTYYKKINSKRSFTTAVMAKSICYYQSGNHLRSAQIFEEAFIYVQKFKTTILLVEFGNLIVPIIQHYQLERGANEILTRSLMIINKDASILTGEAFTLREREILPLLGLANKEIADQLFIAEKTVKRHKNSIFKKLQVKNRKEAHIKAEELNLI